MEMHSLKGLGCVLVVLCLWSTAQASGLRADIVHPLSVQRPTMTVCFERLSSSGDALVLVPFPDGSGRALVASQPGLVSLVQLPAVGANQSITTISTYLDLTSRTQFLGERGFLGLALHPQFANNGRFFVSYICDADKHPDCKGPCECSPATGCKLGTYGTTCNGQTIVAEYWAGPMPLNATTANTTEVRRLLNFGRPYENHNGGDLFFNGGYLFYTSGDGGNAGDPWNNAQKGNVFLGKILRLDVDSIPSGKTYGVPEGNPFVNRSDVFPEIYALGLRNPWRCDVDSQTGNIFCGDVGQDRVEEIDQIRAGYNYGWRIYEGSQLYKATVTPGGSTPVNKIKGKLLGPLFEYTHLCFLKSVDCANDKVAAVIGGVVYRSTTLTNLCLQGKYLYNDFLGILWVGTVYPPSGAKTSSTRSTFVCAQDSPVSCDPSRFASIYWGWGKDFNNDAYWLTDNGIYRIAAAARCNATC